MKKIFLLISIFGLLFVSCERDEEVNIRSLEVLVEKLTPSYTSVYVEVDLAFSGTYDSYRFAGADVQYATSQDFVDYQSVAMQWSWDNSCYKVCMEDLTPNTTYYVRYYAETDYSSATTQEISEFTTFEAPDIGAFSVSATKQVTFSPGNLQYHPANNEWRFALHQTDYVGSANYNISATYNGWIDLFGWGTGSAPTKLSEYCIDYQTFVDWGTNKIGDDAPNTWRTLSKDEWIYIFYKRPNAQSLFALGSVNGVNGTIILPDKWTTPAGVSFVASTTKGLYWKGSYYGSNGNNYSHNTYTSEQWSKMEQAGAVFLPASGYRWGKDVINVGYNGYYWSSTDYNEYYSYFVYFTSYSLFPQYNYSRSDGFSVRLAQDL